MKTYISISLFIVALFSFAPSHAMKKAKSFDDLDTCTKTAIVEDQMKKKSLELQKTNAQQPQKSDDNKLITTWNYIAPDAKFAGKQMLIGGTSSIVLGFLELYLYSGIGRNMKLTLQFKRLRSAGFGMKIATILYLLYPLVGSYLHTKNTCLAKDSWSHWGASFLKNTCLGYLAYIGGSECAHNSWLGSYIRSKHFEQKMELIYRKKE